MPFIRTGQIDQYYAQRGRGLPVIFLHHYFSTHASWQAQIDVVGRLFHALAVDARGHGRTRLPGDRLAFGDMVEDIANLTETLGLGPAHFVGSSQGALVALTLARTVPSLVRSLTVVGPPHVTEASSLAYADRLITQIVPAHADEMQHEHPDQPAGHVRDVLLRNFAADREQFPQAMVDAIARAGEITCPVLVVGGDDDPVFAPGLALKLAQRIPGAELCILPRGGHLPHRDLPNVFSAVLLDFLLRQSASPA